MYVTRTATNINSDPIQNVEKNKILRNWKLAKLPRPGRQFTDLPREVFYPAFPRRAGGGTIMGAQGESQWAAARGLFSTLTTPGMIYGVWGKSQSDVEKGRFRYPRHVFAILAIGR